MPGGMPGGYGFGGTPGGGGGRTFHFSTGGGPGGFRFSSADDIFNTFARSGGMGGAGVDDDDFMSFLGGGGPGGQFRSGGQPRYGGGRRPPTPEVTTVERTIQVPLEELFTGVHKKLKVNRKKFDERTGKRTTEDTILNFDIKPGLKAGSKVKFRGVGDQEEGGKQDIHFIIIEVSSYLTSIDLRAHTLTNSSSLERTSLLETHRRRSLYHCRDISKGGSNWLDPYSEHHRRETTPNWRYRADTARL